MSDGESVVIDVEAIYEDLAPTALLRQLPEYEKRALALAGEGNDVILTGRGPIWLYLRLAHRLHGVARTLTFRSPNVEVRIFDHTAV